MEENTRRPVNPRRRRKTKMEIFKEAYLPTIIMIATVILIIIFVAGSLSRRPSQDATLPSETTPSSTDPTVDIYAEIVQQLLADAAELAADYDYQAAGSLIDTFPGDITAYPELGAKQAEYYKAATNLVTWSDPSQITVLSFHTLIADPSRAFTNADYGTAYNRNFVTTGEFSKILQQLYDNGYILVSLSDLVSVQESNDGKTQVETLSVQLPLGKKPLLLVQTNANYYTYMVDSNGDGEADKDGAGFASHMIVDENGQITCQMVDAQGNTVTGDYDLVPILNDFIAGHPDFSYRGARAVLAPSGYDGIFGYRIHAGIKLSKGQTYYEQQVQGASALVNALREQGYELACYTYGNNAYGNISASEIQADLRSWAAEITPILGQTNILVYAQNSEIDEYSGSKYNVLHSAGFRCYLGFQSGAVPAGAGNSHFLMKRLLVTGSQMAHSSNLYSGIFDASEVLDPIRGNVPH